jgi:predicted transcriptional regulator
MSSPVNLNTGHKGLRQVLGDLEAEIMECMWDLGAASVRDVHECLAARRDIAYTTVMTVMSRLVEKDLLARRQEGRAYIYNPTKSRDAFCTGVVKNVMAGLFGALDQPVLAHFVESLGEGDIAELDALAEIIERKRQERQRSTQSPSV